jgi:uroporphyrinogen III methyltransferase / synthase
MGDGGTEPPPLTGRTIVVTRARHQAMELGDRLTKLGAQVVYCPALQIVPPENPAPFQGAIRQLASFDWLILTSANGVDALVQELNRQGIAVGVLKRLRVACVGPATASALRKHGIEAAAVPNEFTSDRIAELVLEEGNRRPRVLLTRAVGANPELPARLQAGGAEVVDVQSYRSAPDLDNIAQVDALLAQGEIDLITFTSASTAEYLFQGLGGALSTVRLAAIGPQTAQQLRELGLAADVVAQDHTADGLVRAITAYYTSAEHGKT